MPAELLLKINLACSLYMTGLIWFVQIVHYPLFANVRREVFLDYEQRHQRLTTSVVAPAMLVELIASIAILLVAPAPPALWVASGLTMIVWASTMLIQVPLHGKLAKGFHPAPLKTLVASNWIRTAAWSTRSILLLWTI
jgi:uncharacterized membrane protein